jgi:hypothetical protein
VAAHHDESIGIDGAARRFVDVSRMKIKWPVRQTGHNFSSVFLSLTSASALRGGAEGVPSSARQRASLSRGGRSQSGTRCRVGVDPDIAEKLKGGRFPLFTISSNKWKPVITHVDIGG